MSSSEDKGYHDQSAGKQSPKSPCSSLSSLTSEEERELCKDLHSSYGFSIEKLLDFCFGKKFKLAAGYRVYKRDKTEKLYSSEKWTNDQLREFQVLKTKLNYVKNQLNDYDLNEWHRFTRATNPADLVMKRLKNEMKVEFLTQAWCKFYELVREFNLIPHDARTSKKLISIHLCEAPGAFVTSLNHYLKSNHSDIEWDWTANSLNPFYEGNTLSQMINDDRFIMRTLHNWHFGPDQTGDITHRDYPEELAFECGDFLAHLVTADGSIDCQDNPDEQESTVSWLHLKETLTALSVLREGGCFVIKMFTFFECETICLLYLLYMLFKSLQIMKPVTSKEGNSEVYVVCREYKGVEVATPYLEQLYSITEERHKNFAMFSYDNMDRHFMNLLVDCAKMFVGNQINVIQRNIRLFKFRHDEELGRHFKFVQSKLWQAFVNRYGVKPIPLSQNIVPLPRRHYDVRRHTNVMEKREYKQGSHAQQLTRKSFSQAEVFTKISEELDDFESVFRVQPKRMPNVNIRLDEVNIVFGKPIKAVMSSQFCHGTLIRIRSEMIDTITIEKYNKFSQDLTNYNDKKRDSRTICDLRSIFCDHDNYSEAQRIAFLKICETLLELKDLDDLVFIGFPLLTRFNINVLCFLRQVFDNIELKGPFVLYMRKLNLKKLWNWGPRLDDIHRRYLYSKSRAVMSFFPIDYLTEEPLYSWLVEVNNARVYHEIQLLIYNCPSLP